MLSGTVHLTVPESSLLISVPDGLFLTGGFTASFFNELLQFVADATSFSLHH
jgi:hypothetical protein